MIRIFCNNIKNKLERHIKGDIIVMVVLDKMICDIKTETFTFTYTHKNISSLINNSISSVVVANEIEREYVKAIRRKFFK